MGHTKCLAFNICNYPQNKGTCGNNLTQHPSNKLLILRNQSCVFLLYCLNIKTRFFHAAVAQLDRASDYGSEGLGFDSLRLRHFYRISMKFLLLSLIATFLILDVCADDESPRDTLVRNAQRVEKGVLKDLGSLREKGCQLLKNKECVPGEEKKSDVPPKEEKAN